MRQTKVIHLLQIRLAADLKLRVYEAFTFTYYRRGGEAGRIA